MEYRSGNRYRIGNKYAKKYNYTAIVGKEGTYIEGTSSGKALVRVERWNWFVHYADLLPTEVNNNEEAIIYLYREEDSNETS